MISDDDRQALDRLLDDDLSEEEQHALLDRLESDPEAIQHLVSSATLLVDLRRTLKRRERQRGVETTVPEVGIANTGHDAKRRSRLWMGLGVTAAAAAIATLISFTILFGKRPAVEPEAWAEVFDVRMPMPSERWQPGGRLTERSLQLDSGRAGLRLANGVELTLEGPLEAEFVSEGRVRLTRGTITADAGTRGGFVIETAQARVVDLGTRFGVVARTSNETDVVVFEGKVDVYRRSDTSAAQPQISLNDGEGVRVGASGRPQRLRMVQLGGDADSLATGALSDLVTDVKDSSDGEAPRFYGLLRGGMGEGARLYTTGHLRTWHAWPGEPFPSELVGADVICTFSSDRKAKDLEMTLTVNAPCELYVFPDARFATPDWLSQTFNELPVRLRSGPWTPRGAVFESLSPEEKANAFVPHAVWKRVIREPGPVTLGSPQPPDKKGAVMYGIAVKRLQ